MMKSICVLARRDDMSREEFQAYYEDHHAPLGVRHFAFARYVRNHLLDCPDIGFDTISEFWAEDLAGLAELMSGPVGEILREDERRFMDQSKVAPASADETVVSTGVVDGERFAVLLNWSGENKDVMDWAIRIAAQSVGVSLDIATSWQQPAFPAKAVLWTPDKAVVTDSPEGVSTRIVQVRRVETSQQVLAAAHPA